MSKLYYTAPSDEIFDDLKRAAMELWEDIAEDPSYLKEKLDRIKDITNVQDNFMYMVAMFDQDNQALLAEVLSADTRMAVRERMIDGGHPSFLIVF